ncbi:MAG: hypothetical protein KDD36_09010 [Flavobacteriales bacterium]|nr:hypothetical protein [Flavobacteriales bacterium]
MDVEMLKRPIWLVHDNFSHVELVDNLEYLNAATKLTLRERSLENSYLYTGDKRLYKIVGVKDMGNYNSRLRFEFFNPMRKIKLELEAIDDSHILMQAEEMIRSGFNDGTE